MEYICTYTKIDCVQTGKNLTELMYLHDVNVKQLANTLGVSNQAVYKWLNGKALPSLDNLFQISHILNVSMDDIVVGIECYSYALPENYVREDCEISYLA